MVHNISLDKSSQSTFTKAVKNIKALIKGNELTIRDQCSDTTKVTKEKAVLGREGEAADHQGSKPSWKDQGKGVVYLSHIPDGFYEEEMNLYFSQFGRVTRLNLVRSKKNGKPKGFAFIEFLYSEVAQVVADTMNNYLMCGKLLKAEYIPGDRIYQGMFRNSHIRPDNCPRRKSQKKWVQNINRKLTPEKEAGVVVHETKRLNKLKNQLEKSGIYLDCQIEGGSLVLLNSVMSKTGEHPILQIDESDSEVDFKVHPNVIRVVKRKSLPGSNRKPTEKKGKMEAENDVKKRVIKRRSSSASTFSPFVNKVKDKTRKGVSKEKLQCSVTPPLKCKSLSESTFPPSLKILKVAIEKVVPKQALQPSVIGLVECESVSTSTFSPRVNKVEAEAENASKRKARPTVTDAVNRRSSSMPVLSPRVKRVTAVGKRGVSSGKVMKRRFSSPSMLSPSLKSVEGKVRKGVSKRKVQPDGMRVVKRGSSSTSIPSPRLKKVKAKAENIISKRKVQQDVTEVMKRTSSQTLLSPHIRKVEAYEGKGVLKRKVHSSATEVAKRRSLPSLLSSPSILSPSVRKVGADKRKVQQDVTVAAKRRSLQSSSSVLSPSVRKAEADKRKVLEDVTKVTKCRSLSSSSPSSILSPNVRKVKANKGKVQQDGAKVVKHRSLSRSPYGRKREADEGKHFLKRKRHVSTNDIVKRKSLS